ncbi:hypothetical protein ACKWTF_011426 [Chironomus riparius]
MLNKLNIIFNCAYQLIVAQFCLMPFMHQIYAAYKGTTLEWETIFALNLGFNQLQPIVYEIIFITQVWTAFFGVCFVICSDLLYASTMQILILELDVLGQVISDINFDNGEEAINEFKKLVDIHQDLIEIAEHLEDIFSPILLINAFGSIMSLCTACFLAVVKFNFLDLVIHFI